MKKTFKNWLLLVAVAASAVVSWSFFGPPPPSGPLELVVTEQSSGQGYGATFTLNNLPIIADADGGEQYLVFVSTGDGNYFMDTIRYSTVTSGSATLSKVYHYAVERKYSPYAEITVAYDDGNPPPPKRAAIPNGGTFTPTVGSSVPNALIFNGWAKIGTNRRVVEGDSITYIVTYQNRSGCNTEVHGEIVLRFDTSKLEYKGAELFFGEYPSGTIQANQTGKLRYTYLSLGSAEQRNAFFVFRAKNNLTSGDTLNPTPTLTFTHGNDISSTPANSPCANDSTSIVHQSSSYVATAHDPNVKTASLQAICDTNQYIEYTVRFQNEGNGWTDTVAVSDVLSDMFPGDPAAQMTGWYPVKPKHSGRSTRKQHFEFGRTGFRLRGLGEPGYGTEFGEEATYGYVKFKVKLPPYNSGKYCQILPNQASIVFGCNPAIATNMELTPFRCKEDCKPCETTISVTLPTFKPNGPPGSFVEANAFMNITLQNQIKGSFTRFRWYPSIGLDGDTELLPGSILLRNATYTLVASNSSNCTNGIYRIPVQFPSCNLSIEADPAGLQPTACTDSKTGYVHATVKGGTPPFTWHDCTVRDRQTPFELNNYIPGKYYLGVTDSKGCTTERWVEIKAPLAPLFVDDEPNDCQVNLRVSGGTPPYTYAWEFDGQPQPTFTSTNLELGIKTGVRVTVTDNNGAGCSAVFSPKSSGECLGTSDGPGIGTALWVLLGLLFSGALLRFFLLRKNKV